MACDSSLTLYALNRVYAICCAASILKKYCGCGTRPSRETRATRSAAASPDEAKLAKYGQRLNGFLFGGRHDWNAFLRFNDAYRWQARVTLALHKNAALWQLPWEYLHNGHEFLAHGRAGSPCCHNDFNLANVA